MSIVVIGGGAAGMFAAICAKENHPQDQIILLEKSAVLLSKVRVSGGGRCNVTHSCFDPKELVKNYPRGHKELLGPFYHFQPKDMIKWLNDRGVELKTEADGRMFPVTDDSQTIIDCLKDAATDAGVEIRMRQHVQTISKDQDHFLLTFRDGQELSCRSLILATGSSQEGYGWARSLGHTINEPVPSLFTFNVPTSTLKELSGIAIGGAKVSLEGTSFSQIGPVLITHFGFSGPAALKLSAFAARYLQEKAYKITLMINWLGNMSKEEIYQALLGLKAEHPQKLVSSENPFQFPKSFWKMVVDRQGDPLKKKLIDTASKDLQLFAQRLSADPYQVEGKTTNKEEFVTCGGVNLKEVDFKTMESKVCPHLYFAGEVLDIDGVTGGFNFQNAWTTAYLAGKASGLDKSS